MADKQGTVSQKLEDQSIFDLVGDNQGTPEEKEAFLDDLQKVVWDDFLDNDVELLLTEEELQPLEEIVARPNMDPTRKQQDIVTYLESKIPDLEDIMLEKALKLKEDLLMERILAMEQFFADKPKILERLTQVRRLVDEGKFYDVIVQLYEIESEKK
ncbi:MAG: hypothetical protein Q4G02_03025 [bacterium]|nr:hypothetical protein [bacterium]